jgi:hypothetical protein
MVNALDTKEKVMNDLEKGWNEVAQKLLLGKKIVNVRYLSKEEMDDMGWYVRTVAFQTEDGLWFFPSRDDEGNDGGALFTSDEKHSCLPVM